MANYNIRRVIEQIQALSAEHASILQAVVQARMTAVGVSTDANAALSWGRGTQGLNTTVNVRALKNLIAQLDANDALGLQRIEATLGVVAAPFDEDSSKSSSSQLVNSSSSGSSSSSDALAFSSSSSSSSASLSSASSSSSDISASSSSASSQVQSSSSTSSSQQMSSSSQSSSVVGDSE